MTNLARRIGKRYKLTKNNWQSDCYFSKRYALLRLKDDFSSRIGAKNISNMAHKQKDEYILNYLENLLEPIINKYKYVDEFGIQEDNAPIWVCWWTGFETAPPLVQQCIKSIYKNAGAHPVHLITHDNYNEYIDVPDYILEKLNKGHMGLAHFADYLRVSLLYKYGGLWLDATMYCSAQIPEEYFEFPVFTCKSEYRESRYLSHYQWVTFCLGGWKNNIFYRFLKDAFELYWREVDVAIDYLFFDYLIYIGKEHIDSIKRYLENIPYNTPHRDDLQAAMNEVLPAEEFCNVIKDDTVLYKLSWRESYLERTIDGHESVYGYFLKLNLI